MAAKPGSGEMIEIIDNEKLKMLETLSEAYFCSPRIAWAIFQRQTLRLGLYSGKYFSAGL